MNLLKKAIAKAKQKIAKQIKITNETDEKVYYEVAAFTGWYNKNEGGGKMSLNKADKEWIVSVITEGIKPVVKEMRDGFKTINDRITNLVDKNDLKE